MARPHDPLAGVARVLIDGSNLTHAVARGRDAVPAVALVGRLRAVVPGSVSIEIVFDGPPVPGLRGGRIASGVTVRHSGGRAADDVLLSLAQAEIDLVVTDDRALRAELARLGTPTAGTSWLIRRLQRTTQAAPTTANRRPPRPEIPVHSGAAEEDETRRWKPGRGATAKRGNPRRGRRARSDQG
jgi:hypothetical protein